MAIEDRLIALEEEHQLLKGELKQTLGNVRDFLLELNLPALQEEEQREIHEHNETHGMSGGQSGFSEPQSQQMPQSMMAPSPVPYMPGSSPMPSQQPQYMPSGSNNQMPINSFVMEEQYDELPSMPDSSFGEMEQPLAPQPGNFYGPPSPSSVPEPGPGMEDLGNDIEEISSDDDLPGFDQELSSESDDENLLEEDDELSPIESPVDSSDIEEEYFDEDPDSDELRIEPTEALESFEDDGLELENKPEKSSEPVGIPAMKKGMMMTSMMDRTSQINLLTNLIRWVTVARSEIGIEQLPVFLDVYGLGDEMSDELREVVLYLARTMSPPPLAVNSSDNGQIFTGQIEEQPLHVVQPNGETWNRMILELHGILRCSPVTFTDSQLPWKRLAELASQKADSSQESRTELPTQEEAITSQDESLSEEEVVEEDDELDLDEQEPVKTKARSKKSGSRKKTVNQERHAARLKLVLPMGSDEETEIDIGEFNLNLTRSNSDR